MYVAACLLAASIVLVASMFAWFDNPDVNVGARDLDTSGPAGQVGCSIAAWDAGLNHNRNSPGGEHSAAYSEEVATECFAADMTRFRAAIGGGVLAIALVIAGAVVAVRRPRQRTSRSG